MSPPRALCILVYRSGLALAIPLPTLEPKPEPPIIEEPPAAVALDNAEAAVREEEPFEPTPEPQPEPPAEPIHEPRTAC